eukprot:COSAG05_NODE_33_length_28089_cov_31.909289_30_plen_145_part_00
MAPISPDSTCADYLMAPAGLHENRWTDGDLKEAFNGEGTETAHGTCEDGDVMTLGQVLRASEWGFIQEQAEETGGLQLCGFTDSIMQIFPWGTYWPLNCPSEQSINDAIVSGAGSVCKSNYLIVRFRRSGRGLVRSLCWTRAGQ